MVIHNGYEIVKRMSDLKLGFWELHKTKILAIVLIAIIVGSIGTVLIVISQQQQKITLQIFHAGSLTEPFSEYAAIYSEVHPNIVIDNEAYGSSEAIRQMTELGRPGDLLGSADYKLIKTMMMNKPIPGVSGVNYSSWYIIFSLNEMIIAYKPANNPPYLNNITSGQTLWYEILNRTDVTFGRADPWQDPCGYRALMVWGLADHFYNLSKVQDPQDINQSFYNKDTIMGYSGPGHTVIKAKEVDMISSLEAGEIDYLFIYRSVAIQHNFGFIELDDHMNLANITLESYYNQVKVHRISPLVPGQKSSDIKAETIQYGLTIPNNAPHPEETIEYVKFILGYPGLLVEMGQPPYYPAYASNLTKIPAALQPYCVAYPYA